MLYIPTFHENMYIAYNSTFLLGHISTIRYLRATSSNIDNQTNKNVLRIKETKIANSPSSEPLAASPDTSESEPSLPLFNPFAITPSIVTNSSVQMEVLNDNQVRTSTDNTHDQANNTTLIEINSNEIL